MILQKKKMLFFTNADNQERSKKIESTWTFNHQIFVLTLSEVKVEINNIDQLQIIISSTVADPLPLANSTIWGQGSSFFSGIYPKRKTGSSQESGQIAGRIEQSEERYESNTNRYQKCYLILTCHVTSYQLSIIMSMSDHLLYTGLKQMPFYITNIGLIEICMSTKSRLETFMQSHNLMPLLSSSLPEDLVSKVKCKNYHHDCFNQELGKNTCKFSLYHQHISSLNKHRIQVQSFLDSLDIEFDVIGLTELGKINPANHAGYFNQYDFYHNPTDTKCGGVGLLIKKGIEIVDIRNELKLPGKLDDDIHYLVEYKWIKIRIPGIQQNLIVGVIYRHLKGRIDLFNVLPDKTQFYQQKL